MLVTAASGPRIGGTSPSSRLDRGGFPDGLLKVCQGRRCTGMNAQPGAGMKRGLIGRGVRCNAGSRPGLMDTPMAIGGHRAGRGAGRAYPRMTWREKARRREAVPMKVHGGHRLGHGPHAGRGLFLARRERGRRFMYGGADRAVEWAAAAARVGWSSATPAGALVPLNPGDFGGGMWEPRATVARLKVGRSRDGENRLCPVFPVGDMTIAQSGQPIASGASSGHVAEMKETNSAGTAEPGPKSWSRGAGIGEIVLENSLVLVARLPKPRCSSGAGGHG